TSAGLKQVTLATDSWTAIDESRDAYTNYFDVDDFSSTSTVNFELTRPFAKLRVVTNDIKELYGTLMPKTAVVKYYNTKFYTSFNAFEQAVAGETTTAPKLTVDLTDDTYTNEADPKAVANKGEMTLFADYFFGAEDNRVMFTLDVTDNTGQAIPTVTFNTNIPVERNYLTTIYGPILTDANNVTVTINDAFANDINKAPYYQEIWDGTSASEPKKNAEGKYVIEQPSELAWLADQVNGVTRAGGKNFKGETFILNNDIDLGGALWTPIGANSSIGEDTVFRGTFDGNGKTIANLVVRTEGKTTAGLFANFRGVMKNLTIKNADIEGHYKVGVIAGEVVCGKVVDCHVDGARVYVTPYNNDEACHVGGIAGYLSADGGAASVEDCSVNGAEIYAFRDVAGIVGTTTGSKNPTLKGNTVANTTITADQTQEYYKNDKDGNAGIFGGRQAAASTIVDNTEGENVVVKRYVDSTEEMAYAVADAQDGDTIYVGNGEVTMPYFTDKELNFEGINDKAIVKQSAASHIDAFYKGAGLNFKNVTLVGTSYTGSTQGYQKAAKETYVDCHFVNYIMFAGDVTTVTNCTFENEGQYFWTGTADAITFTECKFNGVERAVKVCTVGNNGERVVTFNDCEFTATAGKKAAIEIDGTKGSSYTVYINDCTHTGFAAGEESGETLFNVEGAENVTIKIDGNTWVGKGIITDDEGNLVVNSILSLETALESAGAAGAGDTTIVFEENSTLDMTNVEWTPIKVDGYHGADIVTIDGKGSVIKGLTSALFAGGFAGGSGIIIKNLTIEDSAIVADNTQGYGAFVNNADSMDVITLENCHLKNSSIITPNDGATDSRIGGLIGWTSGYNVTSDGPVDSFITVKNCSVIGCTLKGAGSIGAICGHAGANPATYTTIENCTIQNNNLISTDDGGWRVGVVVGTANVGEVTISNITESGNTLTQTGKTAPEGEKRNYYGRFVPGTTGKLTIDGEEVVMINSAEKLTEAINNAKAGDTITIDGDITLTEALTLPAGIIFNGNGKQINGTLVAGGDLTFMGHTKVTDFSASYYNRTITIGEGACLEITGTDRASLAYGNTFDITGNVSDAKSTDKANIQPSLIIPGGISITGGNDAVLNIKDAYVQIGGTSSKNKAANGTFTINIENSIAEFTDQLTFSEPTNGMNPTFNINVKNSVLTTATKLILAAKNCNMVVDNSTIDVKTYFRNSGNVELKNGSVLTGSTIQFGENGGHDGATTVDASKFTINASSAGHAYDGKGTGSITLKNGAEVNVDYYKDLTINIGANSTFTGTQVW
ncbi:MAG: hypothetical protein IKK05_04190, partial [Alistipes sp.]|nr:hypothetical protein [Alistipes sp.]